MLRAGRAACRILAADDDGPSRELIAGILDPAGYEISIVCDGRAAWEHLQTTSVDLLISDLRMPQVDGIGLLRAVQELPEPPSVIFLTAFGSLDSAVEATKLGAYGYLTKPVTSDRLRHLVAKALEERRLKMENRLLQRELLGRHGLDQIVGESPQIREVCRLVEQVGPSDATILLSGKSGTGKEVVARAIHGVSLRREQPFVAVNCGGLSETLLESELFGHVRGAFTGAVAARRGLMQAADGGTLFLDEVGEMPPVIQVKLLRVLEDREVRSLGTDRALSVNLRVIAATNRDLRAAVAEGRFREDLFYRLNVIAFSLPDLADRPEDIPILASHFLMQECARAGRQALRFAPEVMDLLRSYRWPGNVRELKNTVARAVALTRGAEVRPPQLPPEIRAADPLLGIAWWQGETALADLERKAVLHALRQMHGNRAAAARLLRISERSLYRKLDRHHLREVPPP